MCAAVFLISVAVRLLYFQDMRGEVLHEQSLATNLVYNYEEEKRRMAMMGVYCSPANRSIPATRECCFILPVTPSCLRQFTGMMRQTDITPLSGSCKLSLRL